MKIFLRFLVFIFLFCSSVLFAESGFKMNITLPIGGVYSLYDPIFKAEADIDSILNYAQYDENLLGFESGFDISPGYLFDLDDNDLGVGVFGTIGYSYDFFGVKRLNINEYYHFNSLKLGVDSKLYFNSFAFGLGLGLKIPLQVKCQVNDSLATGTINYSGDSLYNNLLYNPVFGYFAFSTDYIFDFDDFGLGVGIYLSYDFGLALKSSVNIVQSRNFSAFDFGAQVSLTIGESI